MQHFAAAAASSSNPLAILGSSLEEALINLGKTDEAQRCFNNILSFARQNEHHAPHMQPEAAARIYKNRVHFLARIQREFTSLAPILAVSCTKKNLPIHANQLTFALHYFTFIVDLYATFLHFLNSKKANTTEKAKSIGSLLKQIIRSFYTHLAENQGFIEIFNAYCQDYSDKSTQFSAESPIDTLKKAIETINQAYQTQLTASTPAADETYASETASAGALAALLKEEEKNRRQEERKREQQKKQQKQQRQGQRNRVTQKKATATATTVVADASSAPPATSAISTETSIPQFIVSSDDNELTETAAASNPSTKKPWQPGDPWADCPSSSEDEADETEADKRTRPLLVTALASHGVYSLRAASAAEDTTLQSNHTLKK